MPDQDPTPRTPNTVEITETDTQAKVNEIRDKNLDKTIADSFPTSDPPSSIPDPTGDDAELAVTREDELLQDLAPGSWAAVSLDRTQILGVGRTAEEASEQARQRGHSQVQLLQVPPDADAPPLAA